jgi:hypothetical protein
VVFGLALTALGQEVLLMVAFLRFMMPALAARAEPVQIVRTCLTLGAVFAMESNVALSVGLCQPGPPARNKASRSGVVSKVCVGGSTGYTEELNGFIAASEGSEVTGSIVSAIRAISILCRPLRNFRTSMGPWTSSKSNMQKNTMPYVRGNVEFVADSNSVVSRVISQSLYVLTRRSSMEMECDDREECLKDSKRFHPDWAEILMRGHQWKCEVRRAVTESREGAVVKSSSADHLNHERALPNCSL